MDSAVSLCSKALVSLGCSGISSFDDDTAEADLARLLYGHVRDSLLSSHRWTFAVGQIDLPRLAAAPVADFSYAYQLPTDYLMVISAGTDMGRGLSYRILERRLHCDADQVLLTYIFRPDEGSVPPFFNKALISHLAAEFCLPLTESPTRAELLFQRADQDLRRAKTIDSQQQTPTGFTNFPLIECRS